MKRGMSGSVCRTSGDRMRHWINYWQAVRGRITWDRSLLRSAWTLPWLQLRAKLSRSTKTGTIAYYPQPVGPWYTISLALAGTGIRRTSDWACADAVMFFDDRTRSDHTLPDGLIKDGAKRLNVRATDISKAHVGRVFLTIFGYELSLDPLTHSGLMVEKSDENGLHDGTIVQGPLRQVRDGYIYQRLVESTVRPGVTEDLRCACVGGQIVQIFRKEKATQSRFSTRYLQTTLCEPDEVLRPQERKRIAAFCDAMGLDFGSIDVLRDHGGDGRIYIVDVNKTCMPVLSMPVSELRPALHRVGLAVEAIILGPDVQSQPVPAQGHCQRKPPLTECVKGVP